MKRRILSLLLALVMVLSLAAPAMATPDMEWDAEEEESNDTFATAMPIKLKQTYSGMAWLNRDTDLFRLTLDEAKEIRLSVFAYDDDVNPFDIALFDAEGNILTRAVLIGTGTDTDFREYLTFPMALEAGDYYVGICVTGKLGWEQSIGHRYYFEVNEGVYPCEGYHRAFFGHVTTPATCVSDGEKLMTCPCGYTETKVLPAESWAHTWDTTVITPATCTKDGDAHRVCIDCGAEEDFVLFAAHTAEYRVVEQDPTAEEYGWYNVYCADCGELVWEEDPISPLTQSFIDVEAGSFYEIPVAWAVYKEITNGVDSFRFGPNGQCLRAHVVTFLWRAEGCPEPTSTANPFVDVKETDFYYKAVLWAVENGVTTGADATHFNPFGVCNRAQVVTFLHRAKGSPAPESLDLPFTDIPADQWFAAPVAWAVENGITNGLSATEFGPNAPCNRAQVVTFLYRAATMPEPEPEPEPETAYTFTLLEGDPEEGVGFTEYEQYRTYAAGESVIFYAEGWYGYLVEFEAEPADAELELYYLGAGYYELVMPAHDVTLTAHFVPAEGTRRYISASCDNGFCFVDSDMDDEENDYAMPGEYVIFYIEPDEGYTFTPENFTVTIRGEKYEEFWFLGELVEEDPEFGRIDGIFMVEMRMPDANVTVSVTCTADADAAEAAQVRVPVALN